MKNSLHKAITIVTYVVSVILITMILNSCTFSGKRCYKTYTGKYVTIWGDYIIFDKYIENELPEDNYIRTIGPYKGCVSVYFKTNDSIIIWRDFDETTMEVVLNKQDYNIEVFYGSDSYEKYQTYKRKTNYNDTLICAAYEFYSFPEDGNVLFPIFRECIGDSVYIRSYKACTLIYNDFVCSRYDEELNK